MNKKYNTIDLTQGESGDSPSLVVARDSFTVLNNINESLTAIKEKIFESSDDKDENKESITSYLYNKIKDMFSGEGANKSVPNVNKELKNASSSQSIGVEKQAQALGMSGQASQKGAEGISGAAGMAKKAEGGATNDKAFWVGDGTGDKKAAELVLNPTEAPINILNQEQRTQAGVEDPEVFHGGKQAGAADENTLSDIFSYIKGGAASQSKGNSDQQTAKQFASGTLDDVNIDGLSKILKDPNTFKVNLKQDGSGDGIRHFADGTVGSMFKDAPQYAEGMAAVSQDLLGGALSGGKDSEPTQLIGAPLDLLATTANLIPTIGPIISMVIDGFKDLAIGLVQTVESLNKFAEGLAYISGPIQAAKAGVEVKQIQADIESNDLYGERLAKVYEDSGEIWIETQKTLAAIANPFIDLLVPMLESIKEVMPAITAFFKGQNEASGLTGNVMSLLLGLGGPAGWALYFLRTWNHIQSLGENSKNESEIQLDMFRTLREAMGPPINKETTSPTVGI